jgi:predicted secreted protein
MNMGFSPSRMMRQYHGTVFCDTEARLRFVFYLNPLPSPRLGNEFMSVTTAVAIYFIIWWVVLFAVLPFGVRSQHESGVVAPGTDPGAPAVPQLLRKLVWTTIVAGVVFAICFLIYKYRLIALDDLAAWVGMPP